MSSANNAISQMAAYLTQGTAATNVSNVVNVKRSSQTNQGFDRILSKVSDSLIQKQTMSSSKRVNQAVTSSKQLKKAENTARTTDLKTTENILQKTEVSQQIENLNENTGISQIKETQDITDPGLQEAITENAKQLIADITETFDLSEEDIVNAMQTLGLMAADLLQPANLQMLVTEITGTEQAIDLITDSDIYTSLQDLMEGAESMKSELMNEFDLSEEGLQTAIEDNKSFAEQMQTHISEEAQTDELSRMKELVSEGNREIVNNKETAPQSEAFTDKAPVEEKTVEVISDSSKSGNKGNNFHSGAESSNLFNQVMNNIADATVNADSTVQTTYTDRAQMEDIIRQITEKITISSKAEETSMELSLHPASLGNVNILLTSSKDGIVAKFTAQNQIVKEAVEAQMLQLQQKFDEQGIKVTSIEVTIASHSFEQNLEQGNDRHSGEPAQDKKVKPLRRINLSEIEDDMIDELTSDADRIAASMMAVNGNSVDFSA